jgi:hypothetical protein
VLSPATHRRPLRVAYSRRRQRSSSFTVGLVFLFKLVFTFCREAFGSPLTVVNRSLLTLLPLLLLLQEVDYVFAKDVNETDDKFSYVQQFKDSVSFDNSSVHIPIDIYRGGLQLFPVVECFAEFLC